MLQCTVCFSPMTRRFFQLLLSVTFTGTVCLSLQHVLQSPVLQLDHLCMQALFLCHEFLLPYATGWQEPAPIKTLLETSPVP